MPLTREFKETVQARLRSDRKYRKELLREGVECLLAGDIDTGKAILRDYINATVGFERLARESAIARVIDNRARGADNAQIFGQKALAVQRAERGEQHALGEIAGRAEQDEAVGGEAHGGVGSPGVSSCRCA